MSLLEDFLEDKSHFLKINQPISSSAIHFVPAETELTCTLLPGLRWGGGGRGDFLIKG